MTSRATVAIERAASYEQAEVAAAVRRAVQVFGGWGALTRRGDRVLVKPNCIAGEPPERAVQTDPAVILEVCRQLLDHGARPMVGDSPGWGTLTANLGALGVLKDLARLGVPVVEFRSPVKTPNTRGKVFRKLTVDAAALDADAIVNLPKFKAHRQLLLTAAIKNMFGCVVGRRKALWHVKVGSYDNYFARMLVETFDLLRPAITIIDAIVAMEGLGPIKGSPRAMNLLLASTDGTALERVAAELVGVEPGSLRILAAARELGVGTPDLERIDIAGPPLEEVRVKDFRLPHLIPIGFGVLRYVKGSFKNAWLTRHQARPAAPAVAS